MDVYDALRHRRSAKAYGQDAIRREVLERIIEAATWAPNHHLTEPWRFFVLQGDARVRLGEVAGGAMLADGATEGTVLATRVKLVRAPALIIVAQVNRPADATADLEDYAATAAAIQNLLLAAHAEGLAAKWSTGELTTMPAVFDHLGLTEGDRIAGFVYIGSSVDGSDAIPGTPRRTAPVIDWRE
jgi:nitroreductase